MQKTPLNKRPLSLPAKETPPIHPQKDAEQTKEVVFRTSLQSFYSSVMQDLQMGAYDEVEHKIKSLQKAILLAIKV